MSPNRSLSSASFLTTPFFRLFFVGLLSLFFQLACVRWFSAYISFLHYFANIVWIACFIGLSIGTLCSTSQIRWLPHFPRISLYTYILSILIYITLSSGWGFATDAGSRDHMQSLFFGLERRNNDLAQFIVPIELLVSIVFVLLVMLNVGFGEVLGRALSQCKNQLHGYVFNIVGSITGILLFITSSFFHVPAIGWFTGSTLIVIGLLYAEKCLLKEHLVYLLLGLLLIGALDIPWSKNIHQYWSPYYLISHVVDKQAINVDNIGHQIMHSADESGASYSLVHLLNRDSGGKPLDDVLVIGAGSGNDVSHAILHNAKHIDAVEIDPVIADIGRHYHPDSPYTNPIVDLHINDGRAFLQRAPDRHYDLAVYALVDSVLSSSSFTGVRLESFLFTKEALQEVRRTLKDDGIFVTYNIFRQGWVVQHLAELVKEVFGQDPLVISIPSMDTIRSDDSLDNFVMIVAGNIQHIQAAFDRNKTFSTYINPTESIAMNGFEQRSETSKNLQYVKPVQVLKSDPSAILPTDDWPQLYLRHPSIPLRPYGTLLALLTAITAGLFFILVPASSQKILHANPRMFFLGVGFLLMESRAVIQLQLLFGNTWLVTSFVFAGILFLALLSVIRVSFNTHMNLRVVYILLFLSLLNCWILPYHWFMQNQNWHFQALAVILTLLPIPLGSMVFAHTLQKSQSPTVDLSVNFLGACIGGGLEILSLVIGIQGLLVLAFFVYLLSMYRYRIVYRAI